MPSHSAHSDSWLTWSAEPSGLCGVQPSTKIHREHLQPKEAREVFTKGEEFEDQPFCGAEDVSVGAPRSPPKGFRSPPS